MNTAKDWITKLELIPHPEGGYFREVYRSNEKINVNGLPSRYLAERTFATSIYYLLESGQFSSFHKLKSDETWHFYTGSPIIIYLISRSGHFKKVILGNEIDKNQLLQYTIERETWFAAEPLEKHSFSLVGCNVYPGFEFDDFELGKRDHLLASFPEHSELILRLTNS
jgi:hypothetical protein